VIVKQGFKGIPESTGQSRQHHQVLPALPDTAIPPECCHDNEIVVGRLLTGDSDIVLSSSERRLLQALALYRRAIPQTHRSRLEMHLAVGGAWGGLVARGLLVIDARPWHVVLPPYLQNWLCSANPVPDRQQVSELHVAIASCWLEELSRSEHAPIRRRVMADEGLYHLCLAGDDQRIWQIPPELLSAKNKQTHYRLLVLYNELYRSHAPVSRQRQLLQYRGLLDPNNHAIQRFLGQCWQKEEGKGSAKAIACFETACRLQPDYPPYWADLGQALLATGRAGACQFLSRLENLEQECPAAINEYIGSIRVACIRMIRGNEDAEAVRREEILSGSRNPAFYADEAKAQLRQGNPARAINIIAMVEQLGCANDVTTAIKAAALQQLGKNHEAAAVRLEMIAFGSRAAPFYSDEAKARIRAGDPQGALAILDLALEKGLTNDYIIAIRTTALERVGRSAEASAIRLAKIMANSRNGVFYNDEANARMMVGDFNGAREILELAVKNNCANQITSVLWAKAARMESNPPLPLPGLLLLK